jgi:hypothetical protein
MSAIRLIVKLEPTQVSRLQTLAEQCGLTPDQLASTIATLALTQHLGDSSVPVGHLAHRPEHETAKRPAPALSPVSPTDYALPDTGFMRLTEIVGRPTKRGQPPQPRLVPVSRSTWLKGVASGVYPQPVKLGGRVTAWRVEDIRSLIQELGRGTS